MLLDLLASFLAVRKLSEYKPQPVTFSSIDQWLKQFDKADRKHLRMLLKHVIYVSESEVRRRLVNQNKVLFERLERDGLQPQNVVYVQIDEAGSSSALMLNILKEAEFLERLGCKFADSKDVFGLNETTNKLGEGAIVYVDDFVGTGNQFCRSRDFVRDYVVGTFSEFLIVPSICEEAIYQLGKRGVESLSEHVHIKGERPLHPNCTRFSVSIKKRLVELCKAISPKWGLGYEEIASMVVLYRNAPNTVPLLLRGSLGQVEYKGVLPRIQDFLPPVPITQAPKVMKPV